MSFVLFLFEIFVILIIATKHDLAHIFHDGQWLTKALIVAGGFYGSMHISNSFMADYILFAQFISPIFIVVQMV